jgi:hypothetical protein
MPLHSTGKKLLMPLHSTQQAEAFTSVLKTQDALELNTYFLTPARLVLFTPQFTLLITSIQVSVAYSRVHSLIP